MNYMCINVFYSPVIEVNGKTSLDHSNSNIHICKSVGKRICPKTRSPSGVSPNKSSKT